MLGEIKITHSIVLELRTSKWDVVERLKDAICHADEFRALYLLTKAPHFFQQRGGSQPFIWFPRKDYIDDDGYYSVLVETGSHVAPYDILYALHWFHFTLAFSGFFKEELAAFDEAGYRLD